MKPSFSSDPAALLFTMTKPPRHSSEEVLEGKGVLSRFWVYNLFLESSKPTSLPSAANPHALFSRLCKEMLKTDLPFCYSKGIDFNATFSPHAHHMLTSRHLDRMKYRNLINKNKNDVQIEKKNASKASHLPSNSRQ